ncbi:MAG: hypothetical protein V4549_17945 [Bacteroidota bacterium]
MTPRQKEEIAVLSTWKLIALIGEKIIRSNNATTTAIITAIILGFSYFAYSNFAPPKVEMQIQDVQNDITKIKSDISFEVIEKIKMQADISTMKTNIKDLKDDMKEGFKGIGDKLDENNRVVKTIDKNTK